ncbi:MAG: Thymidylate kinase (EC [uncultured Sulfurovum sp.]|uniref:Thymidylate kinase (EC) n=1 Tax=uncultured Sulfurovum sp. TaxID=269237 RepID=A0A6S6SWG5_9BACT|nr:MAG: Thymidylate kinase (EC [uncultured Sulfurovum sp.]
MKLLLITLLSFITLSAQTLQTPQFNAELFERAKKENKIIVMDLEAVWCHWCHVMDQTTYQDKKVLALLEKHFIFVKVDHDARPDLAQRYREYGWPATIFFNGDGQEIVKRTGYIAPNQMANLLNAIVKDPSPEEESKEVQNFTQKSSLTKELTQILQKRHDDYYDSKLGGLKSSQKYLEIDAIEYAMNQALHGDKAQSQRAKKTLDAAIGLIDPVWGGAYQYSTHGDWEHAHYEKIMRTQTRYIKTYALAAKQFNEPKYLEASKKVASYMFRFLQSPEGAFYVSQDADLEQGTKAHDYFTYNNEKRLSLGIPRIDKHLYASSQGGMIEGLIYLYEASKNEKYLNEALRAINWTFSKRLVRGGGFSHDKDTSILYLDDNIKMGKALLALYRSTGEARWLIQAVQLGKFIEKKFKAPKAGILTATDNGTPIKPVRQLDENIQSARFMNLLAHYSGKERYKKFAQHIMKYLTTETVSLRRITEAGILLADYELNNDPLHLTVNGDFSKAETKALKEVALKNASWYSRIDLIDLNQAPSYNQDITYPKTNKPTAFICTQSQCSYPLFTAKEFQEIIEKFN